MGAQILGPDLSPNVTCPSLTNPKIPFSKPSSICYLQTNKWTSIKFNHSLSLFSNKASYPKLQLLQCIKSTEKLDDLSTVTDLEVSGSKLQRKKLAVFVSGGGSNFKAIHEATLSGSVLGDIAVLVTNKGGCGGAQYARDMGIPVVLFPKSKHEPEGLCPDELVTTLRGKFMVDFVLLAGYLKLIPIELVKSYPNCILNIHPSLLPAFGGTGYYGMKVHEAVIASGARYSGPSIHFVDEHYDTGRILAQRVVPVLASDSANELAARVLHEEHHLYVEVAAALCEERIVWRDDGVPLIRSKKDPNAYS
ncbi:Phosphoribosylglycinamide formyltransferase (GART) [Ancistrocladus abbreviatus]